MKHLFNWKKTLAAVCVLALFVGMFSASVLAEGVVEIPESDYIYVNGDIKIITVESENPSVMLLTVETAGRFHILSSGVDIKVALYSEESGENLGVFSSENGLMDVPFYAAPGLYLIAAVGSGEVAIRVADETKTNEIYSSEAVVEAPAATDDSRTTEESSAAADNSRTTEESSAAADNTLTPDPLTLNPEEASASSVPAYDATVPIYYQAGSNETVSLLAIMQEAGAPVEAITYVSGNIEGKMVSSANSVDIGDWLLTPFANFDSLELTVKTVEDVNYTVIFSYPAPAEPESEENLPLMGKEDQEAADEVSPAAADSTLTPDPLTLNPEEATASSPADDSRTSDDTAGLSSAAEPESEENLPPVEKEDREAVDEVSPAAADSTLTPDPLTLNPENPIPYQVSNNEQFTLLPILTEAGAPVNTITAVSGDVVGKMVLVDQGNGDWVVTPFVTFDSLELTVTATDYLAADPAAAEAVYTIILTNPDPNAAVDEEPAEENEEETEEELTEEAEKTEEAAAEEVDSSDPAAAELSPAPTPDSVTIAVDRGEGNEIRLFAVDLDEEESDTYACQWQYSLDGESWSDVEGATEKEYTFRLDETNGKYYWRLVVSYT